MPEKWKQSSGWAGAVQKELPSLISVVRTLTEKDKKLLAVGNAVDYADAVVGNEQGAVGRGGYAYWSAIHEVTLGVGH